MSQESAATSVCPIYEYIKDHTKEGCLPEGFRIPWLKDMWAPGAHDGVALNHMIPIALTPDAERDQKILEALKLMASENNGDHVGEVFAVFEKLDQKDSIVRLYDPIIRMIASHQKEMDLHLLLQFGDYLICKGTSLLAVKLGLSVISPFNVPFVKDVAMEFGVYDEFTYYAARILSNDCWSDGNAKLFELAKHVKGWGRIHAVEWLKPETPEIQDWLLFEGADNTVIPQYSANICLQKAEAGKRLDGSLTVDEYIAIGKLIRESLVHGPCRGITDGESLLSKYIQKAQGFPTDPEIIRIILEAAEEYHLNKNVIEAAERLIVRK